MPESTDDDKFIRKLLKSRSQSEALSWLKNAGQETRTLGELSSNEESTALVQNLYDLGAVKVLAVEIDHYSGGQNTGQLIVELPTSPRKRPQLFQTISYYGERLGFEPYKDTGQSHLFLWLD
jgi:hypothetical protein